jgi:hypothetical protein
MSYANLKNVVGIVILICHMGLFIICISLFAMNGFNFEQFTTAIAIILPPFAGYAALVIQYFNKTRGLVTNKRDRTSQAYAFMALAYPLAFFAILSGAMLAQATGLVFATFEQFKITVSVVEATFAASTAPFIRSMFKDDLEDDSVEKARSPA